MGEMNPEWVEVGWAAWADLAHAESVAARLVEVICEDESLIVWHTRWREQAEAERDAARAEVDALRERLSDTALDIAEYRRAWLADLRAKADECSTVGDVLALIEEAGQ